MKKLILRHVFHKSLAAFFEHPYYRSSCNIFAYEPGKVPVVVAVRGLIALKTVTALRETGLSNN